MIYSNLENQPIYIFKLNFSILFDLILKEIIFNYFNHT